MKRILVIIVSAFLAVSLWGAGLSLSFSPQSVQVNQMSTFSFDPMNPSSQPVMTTLRIDSTIDQKIEMQLRVQWNNTDLIVPPAFYTSINSVGPDNPIILTNRDLITNQDSEYFTGNNNIEVMDVVEANPVLENAVFSGYFPDGALKIVIDIRPQGIRNWEQTGTFTINIRNAGAVLLSTPGVRIGQTPPQISQKPVSFQWNAVNTGFNDQKLIIREFPSSNPPTASTVSTSGAVVYQTDSAQGVSTSSGFSEYLPFVPGSYYAWEVYVPIFDEFNPKIIRNNPPRTFRIESPWFVFRFAAEEAGDTSTNDLQATLSMLGRTAIQSLLNLGYTPTGDVIFEGRRYTGQEALDLLGTLVGKQFTVRLTD